MTPKKTPRPTGTARKYTEGEPTALKSARRYWAPRDRLPVVADVLSGKRDYLDACRHYGAQSNQVYAWAGQAILTERPEALSAMASNADLMQRLDALRAAPEARSLASERSGDRDIVARLIRALEASEGPSERGGARAGDSDKLTSALHRILDRR